MKNWFEVDKQGLARLLERKGKEFVLFELIQTGLGALGWTPCSRTGTAHSASAIKLLHGLLHLAGWERRGFLRVLGLSFHDARRSQSGGGGAEGVGRTGANRIAARNGVDGRRANRYQSGE